MSSGSASNGLLAFVYAFVFAFTLILVGLDLTIVNQCFSKLTSFPIIQGCPCILTDSYLNVNDVEQDMQIDSADITLNSVKDILQGSLRLRFCYRNRLFSETAESQKVLNFLLKGRTFRGK